MPASGCLPVSASAMVWSEQGWLFVLIKSKSSHLTTVGTHYALNAHYAQLGALSKAVSYVETILPCTQMSLWRVQVTIVIKILRSCFRSQSQIFRVDRLLSLRSRKQSIGWWKWAPRSTCGRQRKQKAKIQLERISSHVRRRKRTARLIPRLGQTPGVGFVMGPGQWYTALEGQLSADNLWPVYTPVGPSSPRTPQEDAV